MTDNTDTTTLGTKATYTIAAGKTGRLLGVAARQGALGTPSVRVRITKGGVTADIYRQTPAVNTTAVQAFNIPLAAGDTVVWDVETAGAAGSVTDFTLSMEEYTDAAAEARVSVALGEDATLDDGFTIHSGNSPFTLTRENAGDRLSDPVRAIASAALTVSITEVTDP